jgi:hypothetical protein
MDELAATFVPSPADQARSIGLDSERWMDERSREGFTPIAYFFNTSRQTPKYGLMFSANSGYKPVSPEDRKVLEEHAKDGLDIIFYQCMSSFPGGFDTEASAGLAAYETVAYWAGAMKSLENSGYDVRAVIVDEASALQQSSSLGLSNGNVQATVSNLREYLGQHGAEDKVLVRPIADMFTSPHAAIFSGIDVEAMRRGKTEALEGVISSGQQTLEAARVRLLLGQLTARGMQELGLDPYLDDNGALPEELPLSALPRSVTGHIVDQVVELDTRMSLRGHLIEDAQARGTDLPELGVPGRHVMRAGTTKSLSRPSVRLVPNGRDARKQVVQVPYAIPTYSSEGSLEGFAKNVDLKSGRYGNAYNEYHRIYAQDGRPLALVAPVVAR